MVHDPSRKETCYHCGDPVEETPYLLDGHTFCCLGCQTVYQVLDEHHMQRYYRYNSHPGRSQKGGKEDLSYLDEPNIATKLVDYQDDNISIITLYVPAIHCSSCVWLLEHLYKLHPGVKRTEVDFMKKQAAITFANGELSLRELAELLRRIGYEPKITLQDVVKAAKKSDSKGLIAKLTVAGFCFGNSMMISFPEYFGMAAFEQQYARFFGYMNLAFGLPVLLYSAADYFRSAFASLKQKRLNLDVPLALGIFVLFSRSAFEILAQTGAGFMDTLCSLVFFLLIGKWVQQRTYHHISFERDYRSYFPVAVTVLRDGRDRPTQLADLAVGDRILVRHNEIIPADAVLRKGSASVDFSFVTGESRPVDKATGDVLYAGGRQMGGAIELEVVKPVSQSYLTRLWNNDHFATGEKKFGTFVGFVARYFTIGLLSVALLAAGFWILSSDAEKAWMAFTAVLIIGCPCALALSSPFTLSAALSIFDRNKFYVKNTAAVEQMAAIDTVVFDKTGTISSPSASDIRFEGSLSRPECDLLYSVCRNSAHPLSREIAKWLGGGTILPVTEYVEEIGRGQRAHCGGSEIRVGSASFTGVRGADESGGSMVYVRINGEQKGRFALEQSWRDGLADVIGRLHGRHYGLHLISGDNERRADDLRALFPAGSRLLFNQNPADKLAEIARWQQAGRKVCMLGDGLNDAGALRGADLGIAVSDDINNFSPGCDAILDGASFAQLPRFLAFAKDAVKVIKMSFAISLLYNSLGLGFAVQGTMSPLFAAVLMPISTVTIISFTSLATRWHARRRGLV